MFLDNLETVFQEGDEPELRFPPLEQVGSLLLKLAVLGVFLKVLIVIK